METSFGKNVCACCKCEIPAGQNKCTACSQCMHKKVGFLLGLGILLFPLIFAWFTLCRGYSTFARVVSFAWLIITLCVALVSAPQVGIYSMSMQEMPMSMNEQPATMQNENMNADSTTTQP